MSIPNSARLKLNRAWEHFENLQAVMASWSNSHGFKFEIATSENRLQRSLLLVQSEAPPEVIGLLIGDCVHNFRCVLDHLAFNLPRDVSTPIGWEGKSQFPICDDEASFSSQLFRLEGVNTRAVEVIRSVQPGFAGADPSKHPLRYLRDLSNVDKHKFLRAAALLPRGLGMTVSPPEHFPAMIIANEGALEPQAIIAKLYYSDPCVPGDQITPTFNMGITVADLEPPIGVQTVLEMVGKEVELVMTRLASYY